MITNLTQFERVKSELKRIFYELKKISGNLVIIGNVFSFETEAFTFSKEQSVFSETVMDCGFYIYEVEGLFNKNPREGVSSNHGR